MKRRILNILTAGISTTVSHGNHIYMVYLIMMLFLFQEIISIIKEIKLKVKNVNLVRNLVQVNVMLDMLVH